VYRSFSPHFDEKTLIMLQFEESADHRGVPGGTARGAVLAQLAEAEEILKKEPG
jgi:argininosuccinate lyase